MIILMNFQKLSENRNQFAKTPQNCQTCSPASVMPLRDRPTFFRLALTRSASAMSLAPASPRALSSSSKWVSEVLNGRRDRMQDNCLNKSTKKKKKWEGLNSSKQEVIAIISARREFLDKCMCEKKFARNFGAVSSTQTKMATNRLKQTHETKAHHIKRVLTS